MRVIIRRCLICSQFHNHASCPYCGAVKLGKHHYSMTTGREVVRSYAMPRVLAEQVERQVSRSELMERIIPKLCRAS